MKQRSRQLMITALLTVSVLVVLAGCQAGAPMAEEETSSPVRVAEVTRGDLEQHGHLIGVTRADRDYSVIPKTSGELKALYVTEGDSVAEGQLLAEIDDEDMALALELERSAMGINRNQLESARSRLAQAENAAKEALQLTGEVDAQIEENIRQAVLAVEQAELNYGMSELQVQLAEKRVLDTKILAPADGIVYNIGANVGELVSAQSPLFVLVSDRSLVVETSVSAGQLSQFTPGETRTVLFPVTGEERQGTVRPLPAAADQSGLYKIELTIDNEDQSIKPGVPARIMIPNILASDSILVPTEAVIEHGSETYVFVVRDNTAIRTVVNVLHAQTDLTAVEGELEPGDQVVVRGQLTLADGNRVSVVEGGN